MKFGQTIVCILMGFAAALHAEEVQDSAKSTEPESPKFLDIEQMVREVLDNNPSIKAARTNWEAMKERVPQAKAWEDLRAGVDVERMGTTRFDTFTDNEWMVSQSIPLTGKNLVRGRVALAEAKASFLEVRRKELELTSRARTAYLRLANAYAQQDLNIKNQELIQQFTKISRAKYESGAQTLADILISETDLAKLEEANVGIKRQISDEESQINVLMHRKAHSPLGKPSMPRFKPLDLKLDRIQALALENRPDLAIAQAKIDSAKSKLDLSKREWIPDPEIRVEARQYNGSGKGISEYDTGIFFTIPWLNPGKYSAGVREAEKMNESAGLELDASQTETLGMVRDQLKKIETFHHHYELFRDKILPLAEQTVNAKRLGYETDKNGFLDLITAQRSLQEIESMSLQHLTDYLTAVAELEAVVGTSIETPSAKKVDNESMEEHQ